MSDKDFSDFESALTASFSGFAKAICIIVRLCFSNRTIESPESPKGGFVKHSEFARLTNRTTDNVTRKFNDGELPGAYRKSDRVIYIPESLIEQFKK